MSDFPTINSTEPKIPAIDIPVAPPAEKMGITIIGDPIVVAQTEVKAPETVVTGLPAQGENAPPVVEATRSGKSKKPLTALELAAERKKKYPHGFVPKEEAKRMSAGQVRNLKQLGVVVEGR